MTRVLVWGRDAATVGVMNRRNAGPFLRSSATSRAAGGSALFAGRRELLAPSSSSLVYKSIVPLHPDRDARARRGRRFVELPGLYRRPVDAAPRRNIDALNVADNPRRDVLH